MANRFCTYCGQPITGYTKFCTNCGAPVTPSNDTIADNQPYSQQQTQQQYAQQPQYDQQSYQYAQPQQQYIPQPDPQPVQQQLIGNKPNSYLALSIIATVLLFINTCICFPLGIPAIICSARVNKLWKNEQYDEAQKASKTAMILAIIAIAIWAIFMIYVVTHIEEIQQMSEEFLENYDNY